MALDPNAEFVNTPGGDPAPDPKPEPKPEPMPQATVSKAEFDTVRGQLSDAISEMEGLRGKTAIVDKLAAVFTGEKPADPRDAFVRKEILRLAPELDDIAKLKQVLPQILEVLGAVGEERVAEKATGAIEHMRSLMDGIGLDGKDDEAVGYMEEVLTREIKANPELIQLWRRGNIKGAVSKAFDKAQGKLFAPIRNKVKRGAVTSIHESPKASPRGSAPSPAGSQRKVDTSDVSREGVKKIHDAAFDRLQELMDN
jgi:hypothetical protein